MVITLMKGQFAINLSMVPALTESLANLNTGERRYANFAIQSSARNFVKYGQGGGFGCKQRDCNHFHPILCGNSVRHKKCLNQKCTFTHIKGTIRKEVAYAPQDEIIPHLTPYGVDNVLHASQFWPPKNRGPTNASSYQRPPGGI